MSLTPQETLSLAHSLEEVACFCCGSSGSTPFRERLTDPQNHVPLLFRLVRCQQCGLIYLNPRPKVEFAPCCYPDNYANWEQRQPANSGPDRWLPLRLRNLVRRLLALPYVLTFGAEVRDWPAWGQGRLLDVGCGNGDFLATMRQRGWPVSGCDIDSRAAQRARALLGEADIRCGDVESCHFPPESFDLITLWHVFEHLYEPKRTLQACYRLLAPNGLLVLAVPNVESWEARLFGRWWAWLELPRHLNFFSPALLRRLCWETGLEVVSLRPQLAPASLAQSLDLLWCRATSRSFHPNNPSGRLLFYLVYGPAVISYLLGNLSNVELHARKI